MKAENTVEEQPPSGGCVLKLASCVDKHSDSVQPPSGGCVLKLLLSKKIDETSNQLPSGGCVLKHPSNDFGLTGIIPAAFRRLRVETRCRGSRCRGAVPAIFS